MVSDTAAITVRIVPSRGCDSASCAYSLPFRDGRTERIGRETCELTRRVADTLEELRDDGAGIAARPVKQGVCDFRE